MTHEPECQLITWGVPVPTCTCPALSAAYQRGREDAAITPITLDPGKTYVLELPAGVKPVDMEILRRQAAAVSPECKFIVLAGARIARAAARGDGEQA